MRAATFNLESLDLPPKARVPLEVRAEILRRRWSGYKLMSYAFRRSTGRTRLGRIVAGFTKVGKLMSARVEEIKLIKTALRNRYAVLVRPCRG
jgi:hypothetical protein